jgi:cytochrome c-type biogenesis protein
VADPAAGVGVLAAMFAGMVSFLWPCVLPLVPGYLSAVTGVSANELDRTPVSRVLGPSLLFIASFSTIFVLLGLTATGLGSSLFFVGALFVTRLNREWRVDALARRAGRGGPLVAGAAFAVAWTPCVGPTLGAILSAAALTESAGRGAFLLAFYSAGLAIPFLLTALAFRKMTSAFAVLRRHYRAIMAAGGAVLIVMGVLIWTGELFQLNIETQRFLDRFGLNFFSDV